MKKEEEEANKIMQMKLKDYLMEIYCLFLWENKP